MRLRTKSGIADAVDLKESFMTCFSLMIEEAEIGDEPAYGKTVLSMMIKTEIKH